jgi:hypothetical protein
MSFRSMRKSMARMKSRSWIQETYWRPLPQVPPRPAADEPEKGVEDAALVRAHDHGGAEENSARGREVALHGGCFPGAHDFDTEAPACRRVGFASSEDAGVLVVWGVESMGIEGEAGRLKPQRRRPAGLCDRLTEDAC